MRVAVTGASGFLGRHVVASLLASGQRDVVATGRRQERLRDLGCDCVVADLDEFGDDAYDALGRPDVLIHLAWDRLPNYYELFHLESNLPLSYRFLRQMVLGGLPTLACVGTCFEYGLQSGCLTEDLPAEPVTAYGVAKDCLRRFVECLAHHHTFRFRWMRAFYTYGEGQPYGTLIAQLDRAVETSAGEFLMSGGEQLRDFLPVEEMAKAIVGVSLQSELDGAFNICSGDPTSVRRLVETRLAEHGYDLRLGLGHYPYPPHEPLAFWGDTTRLELAMAAYRRDLQRAHD